MSDNPRKRWCTKTDDIHEARASVRTIEQCITAVLLSPHVGRSNAHALFAVEQQQRTNTDAATPAHTGNGPITEPIPFLERCAVAAVGQSGSPVWERA